MTTNECQIDSASYKDVVIIGNGPSGLCLSYFLAGNWPYWNKTKVSDEYLQMRLEFSDPEKSLVEQDLEYLSDNLEGRSHNPVALLFDALKQPDSDMGIDSPTCLTWKYQPLAEINHLVIGKAVGPGGAWNELEGSQLTISPCKWMELPNMSFTQWETQNKQSDNNKTVNAGLVFSAKNSNFSEDKSLLNANQIPKISRFDVSYNLDKYLKNLKPDESARASMHDVRSYYRHYVKQKNMEKYLLNNATVTSVRRIRCNKLACHGKNNSSKANENEASDKCGTNLENLWEVKGLVDSRDRRKSSSLSHGDINEFRYICKHLVLACGANDLPNNFNVKGDHFRFILRSIRELEDKINGNIEHFKKAPLLIVGAGLSAADGILLAQKHQIKIIHVIRRSVHDPNLVFKTLPKKSYPEYHGVYEDMLKYKFDQNSSSKNNQKCKESGEEINVLRPILQNDLNNNNTNVKDDSYENIPDYVLYDEHQVKYFTSKRSCKLIPLVANDSNLCQVATKSISSSCLSRHMHQQKQNRDLHNQLLPFDEEQEQQISGSCQNLPSKSTDIKISFACILIGYAPDLDFLPPEMIDSIATDPTKMLNTKDNPILVDSSTHESIRVKNLYAMGPLIGDNFVRFGTGGALAISNRIVKDLGGENKLYRRNSKEIQCPVIKCPKTN